MMDNQRNFGKWLEKINELGERRNDFVCLSIIIKMVKDSGIIVFFLSCGGRKTTSKEKAKEN